MDDSEGLPERLQQLDELLEEIGSDRVMSLSELDGFLCGVAVAPEAVETLEWLPYVLGEAREAGVDDDRLALLIDLSVERYSGILAELATDAYRPFYDIFDGIEDVGWEIWIEGFEQAMGLRRKAWERLIKKSRDPETQDAAFLLVSLLALAESVVNDDDPEVKPLLEGAPDLIPAIAGVFYRARAGLPTTPLVRDTHVGRNDPCPCGSGKKYKYCCGASSQPNHI